MNDRTSDEELLLAYRSGETAAAEELLSRYKGLVRRKASGMRLLGGEMEDLLQEGMIALFLAIRSYDPARKASFATYADLLITRKLYSVIRMSLRKKHLPLNSSVSIEEALDAPSPDQDPEDLMISEENCRDLEEFISASLSPLEKEVLELALTGMSSREIAEELGKSPKTTDNALQRARGKIRRRTALSLS